MLNVHLGEDASRILKDHGTVNAAILRRMAASLVKRKTRKGVSAADVRRSCLWDEDFHMEVLKEIQAVVRESNGSDRLPE